MITSLGGIALLNAEASYLATCFWGLYTDNDQVAEGTLLSALTEATWTGYARQIVGSMAAAALVGVTASSSPNALPQFTNSTVGTVSFWGWMLIDPTGLILLAGALFPQQQTIPAGAQFTLVPAFTDRDASF